MVASIERGLGHGRQPAGMSWVLQSRSANQSPFGLDVGVDTDDDGQAVDAGFGGLVAIAAGDRERLAGGGRTRDMRRDFDVQGVVFDGGFHGVECG